MTARKTGLPRYVKADGSEIYASKINGIDPYEQAGAPPGSMTLWLEQGRKSNLAGPWIAHHKPEVGGYFVVYELVDSQTLCRYETAEAMAKDWRPS